MKGGSAIRSSGNEIIIKHTHFGICCMCISCIIVTSLIFAIIQLISASSNKSKIKELTEQIAEDKRKYAGYITGDKQAEQRRIQSELDKEEAQMRIDESKESAASTLALVTTIGGVLVAVAGAIWKSSK
jgi:hypothetical protein